MAEREVVIKYKIVQDGGNRAAFNALGASAQEAQQAFDRSAQAIAKKFADAAQQAAVQWGRAIDIMQARASSMKVPAPSYTVPQGVAAGVGGGGAVGGAGAVGAAERRAEREAAAAERAAERVAKAAEKAAERAQKAQNARTIAILKQQEKEAVEAERAAVRIQKANEKAAEKAEKDSERAVERSAKQAESNRERFSGGARKAFQGAVSVAEGAAYVGLSSEEDTAKLVQGVMKVRGAAMALVGVVDVVDGIMRAMSAVRAVTATSAAAEGALAVARGRAAAATGAAAAAEGGKSVAGGVAGVAGRVIPGAAGAGGFSSVVAGIGGALASLPAVITGAVASVAAAGAMATNAFGSRDAVAGWMSSATKTVDDFGTKRQVSNIGDYGENRSWSEWIGRSRLLGSQQEEDKAKAAMNRTKKLEAGTQERDARMEEDRQLGSMAFSRDQQTEALNRGGRDRATERQFRQQGLIPGRQLQLGNARGGLEDAQTAVQRAQERYQEMQRQAGRGIVGGRQVDEAGSDIVKAKEQEMAAAGRQAKEEQQARLMKAQAAEKQRVASSQADAAKTRLADLEAKQARFSATGMIDGESGPGAQVAADQNRQAIEQAREQAAAASDREANATKNRLQVEQQISQEKIRAAETSIQKAQEEIGYRRQIIEEARGRLQSGQEKFGQMNPAEQKRAIDLMQTARKEGTANLRPDQLAILRGVGGDAAELAKAEDMKRGSQYQQIFGQGDQKRIDESKALLDKTEIKLKDQRALKLEIERDDEGIATRLADEISKALEDRDQALIKKVLDEYKKGEAAMARQREEANRNRASVAGGK